MTRAACVAGEARACWGPRQQQGNGAGLPSTLHLQPPPNGRERRVLFGVDSNLDLAQALFDLGGVQFGSFDLGPTAGESPIYINPRVLISEPSMLRSVARLIHTEIQADHTRRRP